MQGQFRKIVPESYEKSIIIWHKYEKKNGPGSSFALLSGPFFSDAASDFYGNFMPGFEVEDQMLVIVNHNVANDRIPERIIKFQFQEIEFI